MTSLLTRIDETILGREEVPIAQSDVSPTRIDETILGREEVPIAQSDVSTYGIR